MNLSIGVVSVLFTLSLVGAWTLFRVLQSTAAINKKEYQMGGAAAGFLIIYGALSLSYTSISKASACQADEAEVQVDGQVSPIWAGAQIVYATKTVTLPDNGKFHFSARAKDIQSSDPPSIVVMDEQRHALYQLDPGQTSVELDIPK